MPRVLAFIENDMYIRNFITSGAFRLLMPDAEFGVCVSEIAAKLRGVIPPDKIAGSYERNKANIALIFRFNKLSIRALRHRSSTFAIKVKAGWPFGRYGRKDRILTSPFVYERFTKRWLLDQFQDNPSLERILQAHKPDLVIFPVTGVESTGVELIKLSRRYGFETLLLINGWDNLSSKGVFPALPDYLGVWGPQSLVDAMSIHGMPPEHVLLLGCARYEDYFVPGSADAEIFPHKYVLFAGATTPNDEITPLRLFDRVLDEMGETQIKIVYRPHPWRDKRNCFDLFEPESYRHVVLDPQVADAYYGEKRKGTESASSQNFPELTYYPSLLNHAQFMISPMSSMTLEAALFDVPTLVLAHDDGYHPIPGSLQARYRHFDGGTEVPGWFFAHTLDEAATLFRMLLQRCAHDGPDTRAFRPALSAAMRYYLFQDGRSYAERLESAVRLIRARQSLRQV